MSEARIIDYNQHWFNVKLPLKSCSLKELASFTTSKEQVDEYFQQAQQLLDDEIARNQDANRRGWYAQQFQSRGTISDKIASAAVKLTDHDFMLTATDSFSLLFETAKNDSHHFEAALKALVAVWPRILPPRPLKKFVSQYFATLPDEPEKRNRVLMYWYIEDYLKKVYAQFLSMCEGALKDRLLARREAWLDAAGKLLQTVAEGRNMIMGMVVDKMGDPMSKVAHKAYHQLLAMLCESSTNQSMLLTELEKVVFMKNCPVRTQRYCINVMNQLVFNKDERKLAYKCVTTYLTLFKQLVMTENVEQAVTSAVITGLRRAFPYAGASLTVLDEHLNALFTLGNTGTFMQRIASLGMLQQLVHHKGSLHSAATSTVAINNTAAGGGQQRPSTGKKEHRQQPSATLEDRWYRAVYSFLLVSPKVLPHSSQLTGFFALLHKAVRADRNIPRVCAFVHRLLQRCMYHGEAFVCAVLLLVGEVVQAQPEARKLLRRKQQQQQGLQKEEEENEGLLAWTKQREPRHAKKAQEECLWVLHYLSRHSHPSVVKLAVFLLLGEDMAFDAHPLDDLTLTNFLSSFVDAKSTAAGKGGKEEVADASNFISNSKTKGVPIFKRAVHVASLPSVSDPYFIGASSHDIDVSSTFLHRYAVQRERFLQSLRSSKSAWNDGAHDDLLQLDDEDDNENDEGNQGEGKDSSETEMKKKEKKKKKANSVSERLKEASDVVLFGLPSTAEEDENNDDAAEEERPAAQKKKKATSAKEEEGEEEEEANIDDEADDDDDDFDADFNDIDWGSSGDEEDEDLELDEALVDDDDDAMYQDDNADELSDEDQDEANALGGGKKRKGKGAEDINADDFDALIDKAKKAPSRKRVREEQWLEKATNMSTPPSHYRGGRGTGGGGRGGTRGRGSFNSRGRGSFRGGGGGSFRGGGGGGGYRGRR